MDCNQETSQANSRNKPLQICEWCDCDRVIQEDKNSFINHVYQHIKDLMEIAYSDIDDNPRELRCLWRDCALDVFMNARELAKHVMCHAYHAYLKSLGAAMRITKQLPDCTLSNER